MVEQILNSCEVVEKGAITIYSPDGGISESGAAFVVLKPGISEEEALKQIDEVFTERLIDYQVPTRLEFIDEMPTIGANKINYVLLTKMCETVAV